MMEEFLDAVTDQIPRLSLLCCLHLALLGTHLHISHQKNLEAIVHRFAKDLKSPRMKDFERICFVIGLVDFESESRIEDELCQSILVELKNRVDDITRHPKCLPLCLHYLTMKGWHDEEMISVVLNKPFLKLSCGSNINLGREIFSLDAYARINLKDTYKGNLLLDKNRRYMGRMLSQYIPSRTDKYKLSATDKILLEIKETSEELFNFCYFAHALPHFDRPGNRWQTFNVITIVYNFRNQLLDIDLIIAYDKRTNTGIDISQNLPEHYTGRLLDRAMLIDGITVNSSDVEIINIVMGGWNNYVRDSNKLHGLIKLKVEQSKLLGFQPVLVSLCLIYWYT